MNRHKYLILSVAAAMALSFSSCHTVEQWDNDLYGNFDALWTSVDQHYCFFGEKDIDWTETGRRYRAAIDPEMSETEFFDLCGDMLCELKDGHVNLSSYFNTSYYRKWWSDYPQNFNWRLIQEHYLGFDYGSAGGLEYKLLPQNVGYLRYASFSYGFSESALDMILYSFRESHGLIIDVRDNGGGDLTNVEKMVSHFIDNTITAGYIMHKTGPGHDDFSEPFAYSYEPTRGVRWLKPVIVLTNRSTFSAANNFVSVMKTLPHVTIVGAVTGGGSGMPATYEIPCGWGVRMSVSPILDPEGNPTENGISPTTGGEIDMDESQAADGHDSILDFAIEVLVRNSSQQPAGQLSLR